MLTEASRKGFSETEAGITVIVNTLVDLTTMVRGCLKSLAEVQDKQLASEVYQIHMRRTKNEVRVAWFIAALRTRSARLLLYCSVADGLAEESEPMDGKVRVLS